MFDSKGFLNEKLTTRTEDVPVPDLAPWFQDDAPAIWTVRGLTGKEVGQANEAAARNKSIAAIVEMLASANMSEKINGLKQALGLGSGSATQDIAKRIEQLILGSVAPKCDLDLALKLCEAFPVDFFNLTNTIIKLTGAGMMPGKPKSSGREPT